MFWAPPIPLLSLCRGTVAGRRVRSGADTAPLDAQATALREAAERLAA